jgi:hypothetical protein
VRLTVRAFALAFALLWAASLLLVAVAHLIWPAYGTTFLDLAASLYPGYEPAGWGSVILGTLYALVDGWIGGAVLAWLYNLLLAGREREPAA